MLDIKSTNNKSGRILGILLSFLVLSIISAVMISAYPYIVKRAEIENYTEDVTYNRESELITLLNRGVYGILVEEYVNNYGYYNPSEFLIDNENSDLIDEIERANIDNIYNEENFGDDYIEDGGYNEEPYAEEDNINNSPYGIANFITVLNDLLKSWRADFYEDTLSYYPLDYYFVNYNTDFKLCNSLSLKKMWKGENKYDDLKKNYGFAAVYEINEKGELNIPLLYGLKEKDEKYIQQEFANIWNNDTSASWKRNQELIQKLKNITVVFAGGDEYFYDNYLTISDSFNKTYAFESAGFITLFLSGLLLALLAALLLPFVKFLGIGTLAAKIPLELASFGAIMSLLFYEPLSSTAAQTAFTKTVFSQDLWIAGVIRIQTEVLTLAANYAMWMIALGIWFVAVLAIRPLFTKGPIRYIQENIFVIRLYRSLKQQLKTIIQKAMSVDLKSSFGKQLVLLLGINYVISAIICLFWVAGVFIFIPYTIILFIIIMKQVEKIKEQYNVVLDATSRMADGNLEIEINEDAGMFESLKNELVLVQSGFKKAVVEETKSQQMKTELITNVSHDLKTPLTAIITYINLLKDDSITAEERNSYIETIDQKSQRLKYLIEDLFEVSKASSNNVTLNLIEIDLVALIKQVQLELDDKIKETGIEFRNIYPEEKVILTLDSEKTYRIFENLTTNIVKYAMRNTRAYVEIKVLEQAVQVSFKNISDAEMQVNPDDLTERFVRGDISRNTEGSGLGLAIVKSFVELQGGRFEIQMDGDLFKAVIEWKK